MEKKQLSERIVQCVRDGLSMMLQLELWKWKGAVK